MEAVQTVQAAEIVTCGDMRPALALRRNAASVGTPAQRSYQHDTHRCSTQPLTTTGAAFAAAFGFCANQRLAVLETFRRAHTRQRPSYPCLVVTLDLVTSHRRRHTPTRRGDLANTQILSTCASWPTV